MLDFFHKSSNAVKYSSNIEVLVIVPKRLCPRFQYCFHSNPIPQDSEKYCRSSVDLSSFAV